jgi:hypothetical protein
MILIEGTLSLILIHGETSYARTAARAAEKMANDDCRQVKSME